MTSPAPSAGSSPSAATHEQRPRARAALQRLRDLHEDPALIATWTRVLEPVAAILTPQRRRQLLSLAGLFVLYRLVAKPKGWDIAPSWRVALAAVLVAIAGAVFLAARRYDRLPRALRRRPQIALHGAFWAVLVLVWSTAGATPVRERPLALLAITLPFLLWRLGYLLKSGQRGKAAKTTPSDHFFYLFPVWGGSETPYGKGLDSLTRFEARDATKLARAQLAGVKCLILALIAQAGMYLMAGLVFADAKHPLAALGAGIPHLEELVRRRGEIALPVAWLAIYCDLVWSVLRIAAKGHVYVGVLRLLGFNVFRNTYKPLLAPSVVEFWNRYYYYFKELLAEFFFYPTYTRTKGPTWWRTLLAIFAAAFVGNLYYHLLEHDDALLDADLAGLWAAFAPRTIYCFLLAAGIWISMLREQRRRGVAVAADPRWVRVRRIAGVWTFFALIHVWAGATAEPTAGERTRFVLSLFGL
jgi:hypothetical protein